MHAEQDIQILKLKVLLMGIKHLQRSNSQLGQWRVSRAPLNVNGIQTHCKMHSPAEWRVSHAPLKSNGIQTHSKT